MQSDRNNNEYAKQIEQRIQERTNAFQKADKKKGKMIQLNIFFEILGIITLIIGVIVNSKYQNVFLLILLCALVFFLLLMLIILMNDFSDRNFMKKSYNIELASLNDELEIAQVLEQHIAIRADRQFRANQKDLKRYYDLNLSQTKFLCVLGILLIVAGLVIIGGSLAGYMSVAKDLWLLLIGAVSGILIDFVGVIFVTMYTQNLKASIEYHAKLASSNNLLLANAIAARIEDVELRETTLSEIAKDIVASRKE